MKVAITGGGGLVGGNIARRVLVREPRSQVMVVELTDEPGLLADYLAPHRDRVEHRVADVRDAAALAALDPSGQITHVVHAAALAHVPKWERADPRPFLDVNIGGVANMLDWARTLPRLQRFLHVSSGGVYGEATPHHPAEPQPEEGPFNPPETYAISKLAGEQLVRRYAELYDLDVCIIRLTAVFGALERPTAGRQLMSMPYLMARALAAGEPIRISERTLGAAGDWLSAVDVARGAGDLLFADALEHVAYNIAFGRLTGVEEMLTAARQVRPDLRWEVAGNGRADVDMDPALRRARWNAYSTERLRRTTGWSPRPLADQLDEYFRWALEAPASRCP